MLGQRLSTSVSRAFGDYEGNLFVSPMWYGIFANLFETGPKGMTLALTSKLFKEQFGDNAYWLTTGSMILQAILSVPGIALAGYLSQPHRFGRKAVMLYLCLISTLINAVPAMTSNAYIILYVQTAGALVGCDKMNSGMFITVISWCTDWCRPKDKALYFAIFQGCLFGTVSISPHIPAFVGIPSSHQHTVFLLSAVTKILGPLFIIGIFPRSVPGASGPPSPSAMHRRFSMSPTNTAPTPEPENNSDEHGSKKTLRHVGKSLKYIFGTHFVATMVYILINFCDSAVQDSVALFLMKERHLSVDDLNMLITIIGLGGFGLQTIGVPIFAKCGMSPQVLLVIGVVAMVGHFAIYAWIPDKEYLIALEPLGSLGYVAVIAAMAIVSGASEEEEIPRDQGTLLGVLSGLKLLASCVGPLLLAGLTTNWQQLPAPFNWAGVGFALLAAIMLIACAMAFQLWCVTIVMKRRPSGAVKEDTTTVATTSTCAPSDDNSLLKSEHEAAPGSAMVSEA